MENRVNKWSKSLLSKGFTLIELLAVIVILSIISLIAVPKILNVIEASRRSTFESSANKLTEAANYYYTSLILTGEERETTRFTVNNGKLMSGTKELEYDGKSFTGSSWVEVTDKGDVAFSVTDGTYFASKDYDEVGASVSNSEELALLRSELAAEIQSLRTKVNTLENTVNNVNISSIEDIVSAMQSTINGNNAALITMQSAISTNSTDISNLTNKSNANNIFLKTYPVGSIYISTSSTNPGTIYGGTWESYGAGRTLVGVGSNGTTNYSANISGGSETHTHSVTAGGSISSYTGSSGGTAITAAQMPSHTHSFSETTSLASLTGTITGHNAANGGMFYSNSGILSAKNKKTGQYYTTASIPVSSGAYSFMSFSIDASHTHTLSGTTGSTGSTQTHTHTINHSHAFTGSAVTSSSTSNIQPYITVYMWKRTA